MREVRYSGGGIEEEEEEELRSPEKARVNRVFVRKTSLARP